MKIAYYLNEGRKKNLYCRISDGTERVTFSLDYYVDPKNWDARRGDFKDGDNYMFVLSDFRKFLTKKYHDLKKEDRSDILQALKNLALHFMGDAGVEGIARSMFDMQHEGSDFPRFEQFVAAFEKYSGLKRTDFRVEPYGNQVRFHTDQEEYEVDTYEGKTADLKDYVERRSYEEIFIMTDLNIWNEIYLDPGIDKSTFLPELLHEWEIYWNNQGEDSLERTGKFRTYHDEKEVGWRKFQVFMACYDNTADIIRLAYEINPDMLYPVAVLAMMRIYDPDTCYSEYCDHEFDGNGDWEMIDSVDSDASEEAVDEPMFFVRPVEF